MGTLWMIVGPSGTGKSELVKGLKAEWNVREAVSHTTRAPRPGEISGETYHYVNRETFRKLLTAGEFCEHVEYSGNLYAISKGEIIEKLALGDVVIIVEGHGAEQLRAQFPDQAQMVFLLPPERDELRRRMLARGDSEERIDERLRKAHITREMSYREAADYVIKPLSIEDTLRYVRSIILMRRLYLMDEEA